MYWNNNPDEKTNSQTLITVFIIVKEEPRINILNLNKLVDYKRMPKFAVFARKLIKVIQLILPCTGKSNGFTSRACGKILTIEFGQLWIIFLSGTQTHKSIKG